MSRQEEEAQCLGECCALKADRQRPFLNLLVSSCVPVKKNSSVIVNFSEQGYSYRIEILIRKPGINYT